MLCCNVVSLLCCYAALLFCYLGVLGCWGTLPFGNSLSRHRIIALADDSVIILFVVLICWCIGVVLCCYFVVLQFSYVAILLVCCVCDVFVGFGLWSI